jgi:hypothetical protein
MEFLSATVLRAIQETSHLRGPTGLCRRQDDRYASRHPVRLEDRGANFTACSARSSREWYPRTRFLESRSLTGMGMVINAGTKPDYRLPGMRKYLPAFCTTGAGGHAGRGHRLTGPSAD